MKALRGVIGMLPTPFTAEGEVDEPSLARLVEHLIDLGVHGLGTLALHSEGYKLTEAEGRRVTRVVVEAAGGRVPIVVGASHEGTRAAVERGRAAVEDGADALMLLPPYLVKPSRSALLDHFTQTARAVGVPLVLQDSPQLTQVPLTVDLIRELFERAPNACYLKIEGLPAGQKISEAVSALGPDFGVLYGWGGLEWFEALQRGAIGCMPAGEFGPPLAEVYTAFVAGRVEEARRAFDRLVPILSFASRSLDRFVFLSKTILARRGVIATATMRAPYTQLDPIEVAEMERLLDEVGMV